MGLSQKQIAYLIAIGKFKPLGGGGGGGGGGKGGSAKATSGAKKAKLVSDVDDMVKTAVIGLKPNTAKTSDTILLNGKEFHPAKDANGKPALVEKGKTDPISVKSAVDQAYPNGVTKATKTPPVVANKAAGSNPSGQAPAPGGSSQLPTLASSTRAA